MNSSFFAQLFSRKQRPAFTYRRSDAFKIFSDAASQDLVPASLVKEDLIWSKLSLKNLREAEDVMYTSEAEFVTYPTKFLSKRIVELFADVLGKDFGYWTSEMKKSLKHASTYDQLEYVKASKKHEVFDISDAIDKNRSFYVDIQCKNIEDDIAGIVIYSIVCGKLDIKLKSFKQDLVDIGNQLGYDYVAAGIEESKFGSTVVTVKYDARHQDSDIHIEDVLWHIAPARMKSKILKNGLQPRSQTSFKGLTLHHKPRVYLFNGLDLAVVKQFLDDAGSKKYSALGKEDGRLSSEPEYALFKIEHSRIRDLKLFRDNNILNTDPSDPIAVYTYDNIPPSAIELVKTFTREWLNVQVKYSRFKKVK